MNQGTNTTELTTEQIVEKLRWLALTSSGNSQAPFNYQSDIAKAILELEGNTLSDTTAITIVSSAFSGKRSISPAATSAIERAFATKCKDTNSKQADIVPELMACIAELQARLEKSDRAGVGQEYDRTPGRRWAIWPIYLRFDIPEVSRMVTRIGENILKNEANCYEICFGEKDAALLLLSAMLDRMVESFDNLYAPSAGRAMDATERVAYCAELLEKWEAEKRIAFFLVPRLFTLCPTLIIHPENLNAIEGYHVYYSPGPGKPERCNIPRPYLKDWHKAKLKLLI